MQVVQPHAGIQKSMLGGIKVSTITFDQGDHVHDEFNASASHSHTHNHAGVCGVLAHRRAQLGKEVRRQLFRLHVWNLGDNAKFVGLKTGDMRWRKRITHT